MEPTEEQIKLAFGEPLDSHEEIKELSKEPKIKLTDAERNKIIYLVLEKAKANGYKLIDGEIDIVIFSHPFAKAFWKGEPTQPSGLKGWEHQLCELVLSEDRIEYLSHWI